MALSKTKVSYSLNQPKMKEKKLQRRQERDRARRASGSQPNKEKKDWQRGESEAGPDELLKQYNKGKHCLQGRHDRLNVDSAKEKEARLQQLRERLVAESAVLKSMYTATPQCEI